MLPFLISIHQHHCRLSQGFCGVRFNPYLWAEGGEGMRDETGLALYRKAGELNMPVGVMCFKGLKLHIGDIKALLESSPQTKVSFVSCCCRAGSCCLFCCAREYHLLVLSRRIVASEHLMHVSRGLEDPNHGEY